MPQRTPTTIGRLRQEPSCVIDIRMTRLPALAILALFLVVGLGAGWIYVSASKGGGAQPAALNEPITWSLTGMGGANSGAGQQVIDANTIRIHVDQWPVEDFSGPEWLTPTVEQSPDMVTITLHVSDTYKARIAGHPTIGWYDTGGWVNIVMHDLLPPCPKLRDGATGNVYDYCSVSSQRP